jgi:type I restriction enzyme S subunit
MKHSFGVYAMQNTVKATVDSLRLPIFQEFEISFPPTIAEQSAIAAVLSGMDTEIAALEQKRDKYIAIKSGMMQNLLTGKIRLV